jgi:hypothetical protein
LNASGKLDKITINLTVNLKTPHHLGTGGEDYFTDKETFQKQLKRKRKGEQKKNMEETRKPVSTHLVILLPCFFYIFLLFFFLKQECLPINYHF